MQITVVAVMCHTLGAVVAQSIGTLDQPYCREVVVIRRSNAGMHAFPTSARR